MFQITLKELREKYGYSKEFISNYFKITLERIERVENYEDETTIEELKGIRILFNIPLDLIKIS